MNTRRPAVLLFALAIPTLVAPPRAGAADGGTVAVDAVALPDQVACSFHDKQYFSTLRLELAPGIPYTELKEADAIEIAVPVAAGPAPVGVKLKKGKIALEGLRPASAVTLYMAHPFVIDDVFLPGTWTEFHWTDAKEGEIGVEMTLAASTLKVLKGVERRLRARRPCADIRLVGELSAAAFAAVGGRGLDEEARLKAGGPVPVSATAGGAPLARLVPGRSVSRMIVMERQAGWTRIAVTLEDLIVVGWVPAASVVPPPRKAKNDDVYSIGVLGFKPPGPDAMKTPFECNHDVRLIAEAGKQRRIVGTIGAGVRMEAAPGDAEFAIVSVDGLKPARGARFLVRRADLDGCAGQSRSVILDMPQRPRGIGSGGAGNTQVR